MAEEILSHVEAILPSDKAQVVVQRQKKMFVPFLTPDWKP
jgi:hypothetical protein